MSQTGLDCCSVDESGYCRELIALQYNSVKTTWKKMKLFVFRIWDNNDNLHFCISIHSSFIHANFMRLLVLLITRIGKRFSDCGKQETRDPAIIFFLHLSFHSLRLRFVRRQSGSVDWQRAGALSGWVPTICVQTQQAGSKTYCRQEPLLLYAGTSRCASCAGIVLRVGFVRIQALLPKHRDGNKTWKARWPRGHGSMPWVICETRCYLGLDTSENWWACMVAISIHYYVQNH